MLCHDIGMPTLPFIMRIGENMNTEAIIEQIDAEISKLQQAKVLLSGATATSTKRSAGRPKTSPVAARILSVAPAKSVKRVMSAEGKARIAEAQKARWAKSKRADKKAARKATTAKAAKSATPAQA
jgi:hypothetical protein